VSFGNWVVVSNARVSARPSRKIACSSNGTISARASKTSTAHPQTEFSGPARAGPRQKSKNKIGRNRPPNFAIPYSLDGRYDYLPCLTQAT
jgi:hypothetical protein